MNPQFVSELNKYIFPHQAEKTWIDKILDRQDVERIRELMRKEELSRDDLLELLYLMAGNEIKLVNFGEWDRYLLGKYFAWIRDFVSLAETIFDYIDETKIDDPEVKSAIDHITKQITHAVKFNVDVYLYLMRSTLSLGGAAFDTLTKSRFEYHYPSQIEPQQPEQRTFMSFFVKPR
ncbi:hypothetical protein [Geoglobus ahangari]